MRDHEYVRHGTVSLLSGGIDLHSGKAEVIAHVSKSHTSTDFIEFLMKLQSYPKLHILIRV